MAAGAGKEVPKLLAVTMVRSGISKPYWQKRTLKALGLHKMHKTIVHKNTPSVTGMILSVKELVHVRPILLRTDLDNSPNKGTFLLDNGEAFVETLDSASEQTTNAEQNNSNRTAR